MAKYKVEIKKSAYKEILALPKDIIKEVVEKIGSLADEPFPFGSKKLSGDDKYRIRVNNYRILYSVQKDILIVYVVKVAHRKDVYKK